MFGRIATATSEMIVPSRRFVASNCPLSLTYGPASLSPGAKSTTCPTTRKIGTGLLVPFDLSLPICAAARSTALSPTTWRIVSLRRILTPVCVAVAMMKSPRFQGWNGGERISRRQAPEEACRCVNPDGEYLVESLSSFECEPDAFLPQSGDLALTADLPPLHPCRASIRNAE